MKESRLIEPVFVGKIKLMRAASKLLEKHGIKSRHSHPKRATGILRVSLSDAENARSILPQLGSDGLVSAQEAAHFFCHQCDALLSAGATTCPECGEFVGDAHAM